VEMPLTYRGEQVGTLVVGLRRGEHDLHDANRRTLDLIATPLAVALHATALSDQVQQARTATVEAAAAERVRLQRELHDGVGPILTSAAFQADAASNLIHTDPDGAERLIDEIRIELRGAIDDVRQVVYGLRPIELDNAGLVGALRQRLVGLPGEAGQIRVEMEHPDQLPALSPAVELAAYRIASEAINNALTHSEGRRCLVKITANGTLAVTVRDDGRPPSSWTPGVGLRSILERAEELGGTAAAGPIGDGWEDARDCRWTGLRHQSRTTSPARVGDPSHRGGGSQKHPLQPGSGVRSGAAARCLDRGRARVHQGLLLVPPDLPGSGGRCWLMDRASSRPRGRVSDEDDHAAESRATGPRRLDI